jgi:hypothetical protein
MSAFIVNTRDNGSAGSSAATAARAVPTSAVGALRAYNDRDRPRRLLRERHVHFGLGRRDGVVVADVADDAHDRPEVAGPASKSHARADRIVPREVAARQALADLDDARRVGRILRADRPSGNYPQSQCSAVRRRDVIQACRRRVLRRQIGLPFQEELGAFPGIAERHERSDGDAGDTGTRREIVGEPLIEVAYGVIGSILALVEREFEGQEAVGIEAEIGAGDVAGRLDQQRGADQQTKRERDLRGDERRAQATRRTAGGGAPRPVAQVCGYVGTGADPGRQPPEDRAAHRSSAQRPGDHYRIDRDDTKVAQEGAALLWNGGSDPSGAVLRERDAGGACADEEHHMFDEPLLHDPPA